jgi:hypothetical protein
MWYQCSHAAGGFGSHRCSHTESAELEGVFHNRLFYFSARNVPI